MNAHKKNSIGDSKESQRQHIIGKIQSFAFFEKFNPRAYDGWMDRLRFPIDYLEEVGIEKVVELLHHGLSPAEIAKALGLNTVIMQRWISSNPDYVDEMNNACAFLGNERAYQAIRAVENAELTTEGLKQADMLSKLLIQHAQSQDRPRWGKQLQVDTTVKSTMSYVIDLGAGLKVTQGREPIDITPKKVAKKEETTPMTELMLALSIPDGVEV